MRPRIGITSAPTMHDGRRFDRVSRWYVDAVVRAGGFPLILPVLQPADAAEMLSGLDGVMLTGGGDVDPWRYGKAPAPEVYDVDGARDAWETALIDAAGEDFPVLGVCRGAQLLNVVAGGTLVQHLPAVTGENHRDRERDQEPVHSVEIAADSQLATILGMRHVGVNTIHHQAIDTVGAGLRAVAWSDGGIVEAVERADGAPVVAVQWHPELLVDLAPHGRLFLWLTRAAARRPGLDQPEAFRTAVADGAGPGRMVDEVA